MPGVIKFPFFVPKIYPISTIIKSFNNTIIISDERGF